MRETDSWNQGEGQKRITGIVVIPRTGYTAAIPEFYAQER